MVVSKNKKRSMTEQEKRKASLMGPEVGFGLGLLMLESSNVKENIKRASSSPNPKKLVKLPILGKAIPAGLESNQNRWTTTNSGKGTPKPSLEAQLDYFIEDLNRSQVRYSLLVICYLLILLLFLFFFFFPFSFFTSILCLIMG